jgi:hypothetical protein
MSTWILKVQAQMMMLAYESPSKILGIIPIILAKRSLMYFLADEFDNLSTSYSKIIFKEAFQPLKRYPHFRIWSNTYYYYIIPEFLPKCPAIIGIDGKKISQVGEGANIPGEKRRW